ncbi:MAG TPA: hypothetical protein DCQ98_15790 [Planctomycetaceae bacterium]|nr:hypothetical protein [Planctomycetaceae bacterium]
MPMRSARCAAETPRPSRDGSVALRAVRRAAARIGRRGFTLLEVILALALSVLVIGAMGYAIYFHLRVLEDQRNRVEQALVARGLMQLMATDIRAGVQYKPIDMSQLEALLSSTDLTALLADPALAEMASAAGLDAGAAAGMTGDDGGTDAGTAGTDAAATEEEPAPRPGLFGNAAELRVDISRMPRRDEYLYGISQDGLDFSSDLKTVIYRVVPTSALDPAQLAGLPVSFEQDAMSLVRISVSHSVSRLADESGADPAALGNTLVLANEVRSLAFRYFDGAAGEWVEEWDSESMESLPNAVEIVLSLRMAVSQVNLQELPEESYRLVVHLPMAEPPADDGSGESSGASDSTGGASSGGAASGGAGAGGMTP